MCLSVCRPSLCCYCIHFIYQRGLANRLSKHTVFSFQHMQGNTQACIHTQTLPLSPSFSLSLSHTLTPMHAHTLYCNNTDGIFVFHAPHASLTLSFFSVFHFPSFSLSSCSKPNTPLASQSSSRFIFHSNSLSKIKALITIAAYVEEINNL